MKRRGFYNLDQQEQGMLGVLIPQRMHLGREKYSTPQLALPTHPARAHATVTAVIAALFDVQIPETYFTRKGEYCKQRVEDIWAINTTHLNGLRSGVIMLHARSCTHQPRMYCSIIYASIRRIQNRIHGPKQLRLESQSRIMRAFIHLFCIKE